MNTDRKILAGILCAAFVLSSAAPIFSQQKPEVGEVTSVQGQKLAQGEGEGSARKKQLMDELMIVERERAAQGDGRPRIQGPSEDAFWFVTSEMSFDGKLVKGAPYSAQAVTEMTQTLGDGNRIVNKTTATLYRDTEGRTRREQTLRAIGPFANGSEPPQTIFINDPVTGTSYSLDGRSHVARKTSTYRFNYKVVGPAEGVKTPATADGPAALAAPEAERERVRTKVFVMGDSAGADRENMMVAPRVSVGDGGFVMEYHGNEHKNAKTESLGKQVVEGVEAEGTRTTVTIAAGEIGNERPIEIVSERWYSPELQTVVMTRHNDPRAGETVYRLTNINRSEPAKSLFEVPADFTIKEGPVPAPMQMRMRKPPVEE